MQPRIASSLVAAILAGLPTLVGFFVWHWLNIVPTWGVLIEAAVAFPIAVAGIAWAWRLSRGAGAFGGRAGGVLFAAVFVAGLVLAELIGLARGRGPSPMTGPDIAEEAALAALTMLPALFVGWRATRQGKGIGAYAIAALPLNLHLGGTVMHLGGAGPGLLLFATLVPCYLLAGVVLKAVDPRAGSIGDADRGDADRTPAS